MVVTRDVPFVIVISPPVLGRRRRAALEAHFQACKGRIPPVKYMGVNKNHFDLSRWNNWSYQDERGLLTRLKLRMKWEPCAKDFEKEWGHYFELREDKTTKGELVTGELACLLSHAVAWQYAACELKDGQAALIIEDDVFLNKDKSFDTVRMPKEGDILYYTWSKTLFDDYDDEFVRLRKTGSGSDAYFLTKEGAEKVCDACLPFSSYWSLDYEVFGEYTLSQDAFKVFMPKEWKTDILRGTEAPKSLIYMDRGEVSLPRRIRRFLKRKLSVR